MKIISKVLCFPALLAIPFFLGGCARDGSTLAALRQNPILQIAARAVLMGKIYDRAAIAKRNGDDAALVAAANELGKLDPVAAAEQIVMAAVQLDMRSQKSKDQNQKKILEAQADQKYRQALRASPDFPSRDANLVNALGYFLADRGENKSDFQKAETLTREAMKSWDDSVAEVENAPMSGQILAARKFLRANTRDSLAWALFRQGKFQNAKSEQTAAVKEAEGAASALHDKVAADLYFHLGEIERALRNPAAARKNYQLALKSEPDHAPSLRALQSLSGKAAPGKTLPLPKNPLPNSGDSDGALVARSTSPRTIHHEL